LVAIQVVGGLGQSIANPLSEHGGVGWLLDSRLHDGEFIPPNRAKISQSRKQPGSGGHGLRVVAGRVTQGVVDALEMVEIEVQDASVPADE
jgi:hypothetical protein